MNGGGKQKRLKETDGRVAVWDEKADLGRGEEAWKASRDEAEGGEGGEIHSFSASLHVGVVWRLFKINLRLYHSAGVPSSEFFIISSSSSAFISRAPRFIYAAQAR